MPRDKARASDRTAGRLCSWFFKSVIRLVVSLAGLGIAVIAIESATKQPVLGIVALRETRADPGVTYAVARGDTLASIARRSGLTIQELVDLNRDKYPSLVMNPALIQAGWELEIERLPADLKNARHRRRGEPARNQLARPGDAHAHSQPRNASPAISSS